MSPLSLSRRDMMFAAALGLPTLLGACSSSGDGAAADELTLGEAVIKKPALKPFSEKLKVTGGRAPYTFEVLQGSIPGVKLEKDGTLSGTPARPGNFDLTVRVTDKDGQQSSPQFVSFVGEGNSHLAVTVLGTSLSARLIQDNKVIVTPWAEQWRPMWGYPALNLARAGRNSVALASYVGALPWRSTKEVTIPESGSVVVPVAWEVDSARTPGRFGDIEGIIERKPFAPGGVVFEARFTPNKHGKKVRMPKGTPLQRERAEMDHHDGIVVIEACRNDFLREQDYTALPKEYQAELNKLEKTVERNKAIAKTLTGGHKDARLIVVGQPNGTVDDPGRRALAAEVNAAIKEAFPENYEDPWAWLRSDMAADSVNIKFDATDRADIEKGNTPKSLRYDGLHPSTLGHTALSHYYWNLTKERGWR